VANLRRGEIQYLMLDGIFCSKQAMKELQINSEKERLRIV